MDTIGSRIALFRNSKRWTQEKLASEVGILQSTLSEIENNQVSPRWEIINHIAEKLEIPVTNLLPAAGNIVMHSSFNDSACNNNITSQINHNSNDVLMKELLIKVLEVQNRLIELLEKMK